MSEHIKVLLEGQEFSDEFKSKASAIFETAVETEVQKQVDSLTEQLETNYQTALDERTEELEVLSQKYIEEEILPAMNDYLSHAVNEWVEDNRSELISASKVKLAESVISSITQVLESQSLVIPEDQQNIVQKLEKELSESKAVANSLLEDKIQLEKQIQESVKSDIVTGIVESLSESQAEAFYAVAAKVHFVNESQYKTAIEDLFVSYHPTKSTIVEETMKVEEIKEDTEKSFQNEYFANLSKML